jgi:hypothetical protein
MARGKPVILETREFANQSLAKDYFKAMLNRYGPGDRVQSGDAADLASLLSRHNEYEEKLGSGIDHFEVMRAEYATQCFCIVRTDGSREDFSYQRCIDRRAT